MNPKNILFILLPFALLFDGSLISIPMVFIIAVLLYILSPTNLTVLISFLAGLVIDILRVQNFITPLALVVTFILILFYRRAFEIKGYKIIILMLIISSFVYGKLSGYSGGLW